MPSLTTITSSGVKCELCHSASASPLILAMTIGLSVVAAELMLGLSTGHVNTAGIAVFAFFLIAALGLLVKVLASVRSTGALNP